LKVESEKLKVNYEIIKITLYKLYKLYELYKLSTQQKKLISNNQKINKMKKSILSLVFISLFGLMSYAQGSLQFNQVKIVTNVQETVPVGKVWKVTSVYGQEFKMGECISLNTPPETTHTLNRLRCAYKNNTWKWLEVDYVISEIIVNDKTIVSQLSGLGDGQGLVQTWIVIQICFQCGFLQIQLFNLVVQILLYQ